VAKIVLHAALLRAESRGPHFRTDYPQEGGEELAQSLLWRLDRGTVNHRWASL
jgi:aspartate oxidase